MILSATECTQSCLAGVPAHGNGDFREIPCTGTPADNTVWQKIVPNALSFFWNPSSNRTTRHPIASYNISTFVRFLIFIVNDADCTGMTDKLMMTRG